MATLRPSIKTDDDYLKKVIKYIPVEIIAAYTSLIALISPGSQSISDCTDVNLFKIILIMVLVLTPVYMYLAVKDNPDLPEPIRKKHAIFQSIVSIPAILIWIFVQAHPLMICFYEDLFKIKYDQRVFGIVLVGFTLSVPLLEKIIFRNISPGIRMQNQL